MKLLKKVKEVVVEYWEIFVAAIMLLVGVVIGTSGSREKVLKEDIKSKEKANRDYRKSTEKAIKKHTKASEAAEERKAQREADADIEKSKQKEELLKDSDNLDRILKEKYDLDGE